MSDHVWWWDCSKASQSHGFALQDTDKVALLISSPHFIGCQCGMPYSFPVHHKIKKHIFVWRFA